MSNSNKGAGFSWLGLAPESELNKNPQEVHGEYCLHQWIVDSGLYGTFKGE